MKMRNYHPTHRKNFKTYTFSLVAGQDYTLRVMGTVYAVVDSASPFTVTFDESNKLTDQVAGMVFNFDGEYQDVVFNSPVDQTIKVLMGFGQYADARASVNATINTTIEPSDTLNNPGDVVAGDSAVLVAAANPKRKEIELCLSSNALNSVRVGNSTVTSTSGSILEPGMSKVFGTEAALYVIREVTDETVSVLEMERQ